MVKIVLKEKTNEQKKKKTKNNKKQNRTEPNRTEPNRTVLHGADAFTEHIVQSTEPQCNKPCQAKLSKQYTTISDYYNL